MHRNDAASVTTVDEARRYRRAVGVVSEIADDRALLVDVSGVELITLNPVGTLLWAELTEMRTVHELTTILAARFPSQPDETLRHDVVEFLTELQSAGLIDAAG